jgi:hypothetical protein
METCGIRHISHSLADHGDWRLYIIMRLSSTYSEWQDSSNGASVSRALIEKHHLRLHSVYHPHPYYWHQLYIPLRTHLRSSTTRWKVVCPLHRTKQAIGITSCLLSFGECRSARKFARSNVDGKDSKEDRCYEWLRHVVCRP